ncbi:metallophosphoesterase [uncultured Clostridium sp.]|uniref:metallophosphoesterase family protein n=1 Tax=uncultured Clostridium sp. TaxID=59620 RepID=UPI00263858F3|nr:metallophosphoesterase [uncultured Clostridium sp.]
MNILNFAIFTDLHFDHIPDGYERLSQFIQKIKNHNLNFVIQLGDLCIPKDENKYLLELLESINIPIYHVLGNHDSDLFSKKEILKFFKLNNSYYCFKYGNIKFIVLDTCFIKRNNQYFSFNIDNYNKSTDIYPILPDYEFDWLQNELNDDENLFYIIFSHHSLENNFNNRGIFNRVEIQNLINNVNTPKKKILCCINGHDHADSIDLIHKTHYISLNSMSYIWCGPEYEHFDYSQKTHEQFPFLKDLILYKDPLYATITINNIGTLFLNGLTSDYKSNSPLTLNMPSSWNGRDLSSKISSFII